MCIVDTNSYKLKILLQKVMTRLVVFRHFRPSMSHGHRLSFALVTTVTGRGFTLIHRCSQSGSTLIIAITFILIWWEAVATRT